MRLFLYKILQPVSIFFRRLNSNKIRVLAYHDIKSPEAFERQIAYLKNYYTIISIEQLIQHIKTGAQLPPKAVLITFDDGDISVYEAGMKVLKKYDVPALLFVITGLIGSRKSYWWKRVERSYTNEGKSYQEARKMIKKLKSIANKERLTFLSSINEAGDVQLSLQQLREFMKYNIGIANHTHTHPMLNFCTTAEIEYEMAESRSFFQTLGSGHFSVFAYPNGNFDLETESILKRSGIEFAFLFDHAINSLPVNPLRISRLRVNSDDDLAEFKVKVSGLHTLIKRP